MIKGIKLLKFITLQIVKKVITVRDRIRKTISKCFNLLPNKFKIIYLTNAIKRKNKRISPSNNRFTHPVFNEGKHCFAAQPEYFRQTYYDMIGENGLEFKVSSLDKTRLNNLKLFCIENKIKNLWLFRPEFFVLIEKDLVELKELGICIICYSTEPIPSEVEFHSYNSHFDQLKRLESLLDSKRIHYDFFIHFDQKSEGLLSTLGFHTLLSHPLPVSFNLFKYENVEKKYDVCFIGRSTEYRERFLAPLKSQFNTLHIAHGVFDSDACTLMNQSHIIINLHNEPYSNFETRVIQAKLINSLLMSEALSLNYLSPQDEFIEFLTPMDLFEKVKCILRDRDNDNPMKYKFRHRELFRYSHLIKSLEELSLKSKVISTHSEKDYSK